MERGTDAVAHIIPHYAVAVGFHILLNCFGDIVEAAACFRITDALEETLTGDFHQPLGFLADLTGGIGAGAVTYISFVRGTHIQRNDVAFLNHPSAGDSVDDFVVHGQAHAFGKPAVVQKRRRGPLGADELVNCFVDLLCRHSGSDHRAAQRTGRCGDLTGLTHQVDLTGRLDGDHHSVIPRAL